MCLRAAFLLLSIAAMAAGCGGGGDGGGSPASLRPQDVTIEIVAGDEIFDLETIRVPEGSRVMIELANLDADPHNIAIYTSAAAEQEVFVSDTIAGRGTKTSGSFDAPPPGEYFFRCDVHPVTMTGDLIVESR